MSTNLSLVTNKISELTSSFNKWEAIDNQGEVECNECQTVLKHENKQKHVEKIVNRINEKKSEQQTLENLFKTESATLSQYELANKQNQTNKQLKTELEGKLQTEKSKTAQLNQLLDIHKQKQESIQGTIDNLKDIIISLSNEIDSLYKQKEEKEKLKAINYNAELTKISNDKQELVTKKENTAKDKTEAETQLAQVIQTLGKQKIDTEELKKLDFEVSIQRKLLDTFGKTGVSSLLVESVINELQSLANKYISIFEPGVTILFELNTNKGILKIFVLDNGRKRTYKLYSGGEKTLINLSIRLALSDVLNLRAVKKIQFLVLDEVFGSLCETNRETVASVFSQLRNKFSQVFVISHTDMKDTFEHLIHVDRYKTYAEAKLLR
jgi:DNA repair exonuclease SbcCD ATPase subunit